MSPSPLSLPSCSDIGLRSPSFMASSSPQLPLASTQSPSLRPGRRLLLLSARSGSYLTVDKAAEGGSIRPVYRPTPPDRDLRTPHSGYHFDRSSRQFVESWYFKVSIPENKQSFCSMYSVENPAFRKKLTPFEELQFGRRFTGVGAQILGADDKYICQYSDESYNFW